MRGEDIWGKKAPGRRDSWCKGPEACALEKQPLVQ